MNLGFSGKIFAGIGAVILLMALNAIFDYASLDNTLNGYNQILDRENQAIFKLHELNLEMGRAELAENEFNRTLDEKSALEHRKATAAMAKKTRELGQLWAAMGDINAESEKSKLLRLIEEYEISFATEFQAMTQKGRDDMGLIGEFRKSVHDLEDMLEGANAIEIERDLLMLRRHEKDYLMRKEAKYVEKAYKQLDRLRASCDRFLQRDQAAKASALLDDYAAKFAKVVEMEAQAAQARAQLVTYDKTMSGSIAMKLSAEKERLENNVTRVKQSAESAKFWTLALSSGGTIVGVLLAFSIVSSAIRPITAAAPVIGRIAQGDFTQSVAVTSKDEIGQLASAINQMSLNLRNTMTAINQNARELAASSKEMADVASHMANGSGHMKTQSEEVAAATEELSANISAMAVSVEEISANVSSIATGAERMSTNMNSVSAAVEQMSTSIEDIAKSAKNAGAVAGKAQSMSSKASGAMNNLGDAAKKIGEVTSVIKRIAEQTNLLALNATIEAASAGAAGKGFAVVANEIKELASQSANAAEDIASRIDGVQGNTKEAVLVMKDVTDVIGAINNAVESINASVREQTQVATSISGNVNQAADEASGIAKSIAELAKGANAVAQNAGEAAKGLSEISRNINQVNQAAGAQSAGAQQVSQSSGSLKRIAGEMDASVKQFKVA
ncbi:MAG: methyl-accepting chemotaxis protein [Nitrospinota bacterium]|nr:methyl-accepting chemotaxis protein [Nitrospinota bacterium]